MKKLLSILLITCCALPVMAAKRQSEEIITPLTQLEKRQIQTKTYPAQDRLLVMKSVLNVLQDEGYVVYNVNSLLGFIYGVKDVEINDDNVDISKEFGLTKSRLNYNGVKVATLETTANVTDYGKDIRVRINFRRKLLNEYGNAQFIDDINEPEFYADFYEKLDKAIALQKGIEQKVMKKPAPKIIHVENVPEPEVSTQTDNTIQINNKVNSVPVVREEATSKIDDKTEPAAETTPKNETTDKIEKTLPVETAPANKEEIKQISETKNDEAHETTDAKKVIKEVSKPQEPKKEEIAQPAKQIQDAFENIDDKSFKVQEGEGANQDIDSLLKQIKEQERQAKNEARQAQKEQALQQKQAEIDAKQAAKEQKLKEIEDAKAQKEQLKQQKISDKEAQKAKKAADKEAKKHSKETEE